MEFKEYYIESKEGESNCVVRTFCKIFNKEYEEVLEALKKIAEELCYDDFNEIEVFETYLEEHGMKALDLGVDSKIKDVVLEKGKYAIFCWDKKQFYHMVPIIDDVVYDKNDECLELFVLTIYGENKDND